MKILCLVIILTTFFTVSKSQNKDKIQFSGFEWLKKISPTPTGPGNNIFGTHPKNVTLDKKGNLVLKIKGKSSCAEVFSENFFKEGRYETTIITNSKRFHPQMVFGIFLYDHNAKPHHNEIDIEYALWGRKDNKNMQYAVHTNDKVKVHRFSFKKKKTSIKHIIDITNDSIHFKSMYYDRKNNAFQIINEKAFIKPKDFNFNNTRFHYNLWLIDNKEKGLKHLPKVKILAFKNHLPIK